MKINLKLGFVERLKILLGLGILLAIAAIMSFVGIIIKSEGLRLTSSFIFLFINVVLSLMLLGANHEKAKELKDKETLTELPQF
jgi:hypothetical protein